MKSRRAVSPVIATVILVAVAITITIAVAYWMGGIAGGYTKFEKVEISTIYCSSLGDPNPNVWTITVTLKNTGSAASTLNAIYVNQYLVQLGKSAGEASADNCTSNMPLTYTLEPGESKSFEIGIANGFQKFSSGTTVNVKFHSAGGMDYIKVVELV